MASYVAIAVFADLQLAEEPIACVSTSSGNAAVNAHSARPEKFNPHVHVLRFPDKQSHQNGTHWLVVHSMILSGIITKK